MKSAANVLPVFLLTLPFVFFRFWFWEAPISLLFYFVSLNTAFLQLFSLPLMLKTFFKPLKNEYRKGLVGFSIGMGITIKSMLIFVDVLILFILLILEAVIMVSFVLVPFIAAGVLFL